jgi:formylglycine-generating enzyme required for sulfatase activity
MGDQSGRFFEHERPVHDVDIDYKLAVGRYEVTFAEWDACVSDGGCGGYLPKDQGWGRGDRPVINVGWNDAKRYALWLSRKTGKSYRLLNEAEWEYAARAGSRTHFSFGDDLSGICTYANAADLDAKHPGGSKCHDGYGDLTAPVGRFKANAFGLFDMHGNVSEWTEDCWHDSYQGAPEYGKAWTWAAGGDCGSRVDRGGSFNEPGWHLRAAKRTGPTTDTRLYKLGFRVAREFVERPDAAEELFDRAYELHRFDDHEGALLRFTLGFSLDDEDFRAHYRMANVFKVLKRRAEARAHFRKAVRHGAGTHEGRFAEAHLARMQQAQTDSRAPGESFKDCETCPEMVVIPAGTYLMGDAAGKGGGDEKPVHEVKIHHSFATGIFEVTFAEWDACVAGGGCDGYRPDDQKWGRERRPVINVGWKNAKSYVAWLSKKTGASYRLLSEAEWEYAARAGSGGAFSFGDELSELCQFGNGTDKSIHTDTDEGAQFPNANMLCSDGFAIRTAPVGSFQANQFGLHDMHGNVSEWVEDCFHESYNGAPDDGSAWIAGVDCGLRISRGGSWFSLATHMRAASRMRTPVGWDTNVMGMRVARDLQ